MVDNRQHLIERQFQLLMLNSLNVIFFTIINQEKIFKTINFFLNSKGCVKKKFRLSSTKLRQIWPSVRNSINAQGRFHNYQARQAVIAERELVRLDAEEAATRARISNLEQE